MLIDLESIWGIFRWKEESAIAILETKEALSSPHLKGDLAFIKSHFGSLPGKIAALERRDIPLTEAVKIEVETEEDLQKIPGKVGGAVAGRVGAL